MPRNPWGQGSVIDVGGGRLRVPRLPLGTLRIVAVILVALLLLATTYYQIEPEEVGVVQLFGAYVRTTGPGPHLKLPFGIEQVTKVPVQRQLKMEFGFRTLRPGIRSEFAADTPETTAESLMLTGDLNVAVVEWIVQYRIKDPKAFLFNVRNVPGTFRDMSEAAMRSVVGDHSVDEVITVGRAGMALAAKQELQRLCDLYSIGIEVQQLVLQDVNPPGPVRPAFNEVNQAIQEKERAINEAWAEYNQAVPRAKGEAEQAVRAAEGYALDRENRAVGDADRFDALYAEYRKAPDVTRRRMYLETMGEIVPRLGRKVIVDDKARGVLPLLQLGAAASPAGGAGKGSAKAGAQGVTP
jgi:membrane protease subunit HflK